MITQKDKVHFTYNGKTTSEMGVSRVHLNGGMFEEDFVADISLDVKYDNVRNSTIFSGQKLEPLEFELVLAFDKEFNKQKIDDVVKWLYLGYFAQLRFIEGGNYSKAYYCMPNGKSTITHTGTNMGYITINMMTNSPYVFNNPGKSNIQNGKEFTLNNDGLDNPEMKIELIVANDGRVTINKDGKDVYINGLKRGEKITLYPLDEDIESNLIGVTRYSNISGDLTDLLLKNGKNKFTLTNANGVILTEFYYLR